MTPEDQTALAGRLDAHVQTLRMFCLDGMHLFNALSDRLPDLKALMAAAGPAGMEVLARRFPHLGCFAALLASLPRGGPGVAFIPPRAESGRGQGTASRPAPLPFRLQRAAALLEGAEDPLAADAQAACREVASRLVLLEETLARLLDGEAGAAARAREVLALDWS